MKTAGLWFLAAVLLAGSTLAVAGVERAPYRARSPHALRAVLLDERFTEGRWTEQTAWSRCVSVPGGTLVPRTICGKPLVRGSRRFARLDAAFRELRGGSAPGDTSAREHVSALWSMRRQQDPGRAVGELRRASERSPRDPSILNDLAVAYLALGARDQSLDPMLRALDAAERALAIDSLMVEAWYNRALAAERLYLVTTAAEAWSRYAAIETDPRWREEALARARALAPRDDTASWATVIRQTRGMDEARRRERLRARVMEAPNHARDFALDLLGQWGENVLAGKTAEAGDELATAREIGAVVPAGGDRTITLSVRAIDAATVPARRRALATAHAGLRRGIAAYRGARYHDADVILAVAERVLERGESGAAGWAGYFRAASRIWMADYASADTILARLARGSARDQPALVGRATWALGTSHVRRDLSDEASRFYAAAQPYLARAGEGEYAAALHMLFSESLWLAGQQGAAREHAYRGLRGLSVFPRSTYYKTQLTIVTIMAGEMNVPRGAMVLSREKMHLERAAGDSSSLALALRLQARARLALGDSAGARADVTEARRIALTLKDSAARNRVIADVEAVRAELLMARDPAGALALLEAVIRTYDAHRLGVYLPDALNQAARAARALGRMERAHAYAERAVQTVETLQDSTHSLETRVSRLETLERMFDAAIGIELERGDAASAFTYLERARVASWPRSGRTAAPPPRPPTPEAVARRLPGGTLFVEYAVLPDRLVTWVLSRGHMRQQSVAITRDSVAKLVSRFQRAGYRSMRAGDAGAVLSDLVVGPLQELGHSGPIVVVPDRELNSVPFSALSVPATGRLVVEHHAVSVLPSAAFLVAAHDRPRRPRQGSGARPLVVGEPATDRVLGLDSLPDAAREAEGVARIQAPATLLSGTRASRAAVLRLLPQASLFHFAGHAVYNPDHPELSYLALAPDSAGGDGILRAREIGTLAATNLMTVVLSACSTLSPRPTHAGAPAGLAYSFLRAGAPATVSTLWDVTDQTTTGVMVEFHRRLAEGVPAAEALRLAQVAALRSHRAQQRSPVAWAAFIYTGP